MPYGPSGTAPDVANVREHELYFERLEKAGLGRNKRPDLLVFQRDQARKVEEHLKAIGGVQELPFTPEENPHVARLIEAALLGIECENSLWVAEQMPYYGSKLRPMRRLAGLPGLRKDAVVPTIILKGEDRDPLKKWQRTHGRPIHIWHVFYDLAFGISLKEAERLIRRGYIQARRQVYQAPGGSTTTKETYHIYYQHAYVVGRSQEPPRLLASSIKDKNGHILPFVRFKGGRLLLAPSALSVLDQHARDSGTR